jgi:hypothetical protein
LVLRRFFCFEGVHKTLLVALLMAVGCADFDDVREDPKVAVREPLHHRHVCGNALPGEARCLSLVRCNRRGQIQPFAAPAGYGPGELASAYHLPVGGGAGRTIAIVDAMDAPDVEADLAVYRAHFGLPPCTTANGCFQKVGQSGSPTALPGADSGWAEEITLDVDMASAICPSCKILLVEANSPTTANLGAAVNTAVRLGASVVSNSYGGDESAQDPATTAAFYDHPGVLITASSGDDGFGVSYPAAAPGVLAVGGTTLNHGSGGRGWTETAWSGAGSGCSSVQRKPAWQHDAGCARRTVADVSAVADPNTGVAVYQRAAGGWLVFGGTSVAAPVVASIFALTGHGAETPQYPYANANQFYDASGGSNGTCTPSYLCSGTAGYDGPTGVGTPNGTAMLSGVAPAAVAARAPARDFSISAGPSAIALAPGGTATATITVSGGQTVSLASFTPPDGVSVSISPAQLTNGTATVRVVSNGALPAPFKLVFTGTSTSGVHATSLTVNPR